MQLKIITDELYEIMWELQPTHETLAAIKAKLSRMVDKAWEDYSANIKLQVRPTAKPAELESAI